MDELPEGMRLLVNWEVDSDLLRLGKLNMVAVFCDR
jgi:hypothetical protein